MYWNGNFHSDAERATWMRRRNPELSYCITCHHSSFQLSCAKRNASFENTKGKKWKLNCVTIYCRYIQKPCTFFLYIPSLSILVIFIYTAPMKFAIQLSHEHDYLQSTSILDKLKINKLR